MKQRICPPPATEKFWGKSKRIKQSVIWAIAAVAIAAASYIVLMRDISVTLLPHAGFFSLVYGVEFEFAEGVGYVAKGGAFAITKGCMGANLFLSMFLMLILGFGPKNGDTSYRVRFFVEAYLITLGAAFAVTLVRIALSMPFLGNENSQLIHNILSLLIYFGCMAALYFIMEKRRTKRNEDVE